MNYVQLRAAIQEYSEDFEASFVDNIDTFIRLAEGRILLQVRLPRFRKDALGAATLNDPLVAAPTDFLAPDSLVTVDSGQLYPALNKDPEFLDEAYPDLSVTGRPRFYSQQNERTLRVAPTPDKDYVLRLGYFYEPPSIVTAGTTWLGDHFFHALISGALVEAAIYMKSEDALFARHNAQFQADLAMDQGYAKGRTRKDTYEEPDQPHRHMITASVGCTSFKREVLLGLHNFTSHEFRIALYSAAAPLDSKTTTYITEFEISAPGYTAGGKVLAGVQIFADEAARVAYATWNDPVWINSEIVARGALIYNQTAGQRAVLVLDFGSDQTSNLGEFAVRFPPPEPDKAVLRVG